MHEYTVYFSLNGTATVEASSSKEAEEKANIIINQYHKKILDDFNKDLVIEVFDVEID